MRRLIFIYSHTCPVAFRFFRGESPSPFLKTAEDNRRAHCAAIPVKGNMQIDKFFSDSYSVQPLFRITIIGVTAPCLLLKAYARVVSLQNILQDLFSVLADEYHTFPFHFKKLPKEKLLFYHRLRRRGAHIKGAFSLYIPQPTHLQALRKKERAKRQEERQRRTDTIF